MKDILHHKMQDSFFGTILKIQNPAYAGFYILQSTKQEQKIKKVFNGSWTSYKNSVSFFIQQFKSTISSNRITNQMSNILVIKYNEGKHLGNNT